MLNGNEFRLQVSLREEPVDTDSPKFLKLRTSSVDIESGTVLLTLQIGLFSFFLLFLFFFFFFFFLLSFPLSFSSDFVCRGTGRRSARGDVFSGADYVGSRRSLRHSLQS